MRDKLGYNDPIYVQYWNWVKGVAQGDLGKSTTHKLPTLDIILERMPNTIFLALTSLLITYVFAFILGMYAGRKPYTLADNFIAGYNYFCISGSIVYRRDRRHLFIFLSVRLVSI